MKTQPKIILQNPNQPQRRRRVAINVELEWPYRRHLEVYAGIQQYAQEKGTWDCEIDEYAEATLRHGDPACPVYDGVIARATMALAKQSQRCQIPIVNLWFNSPAWSRLPSVLPDAAAMGRLAAVHLMERGFRRFAFLSRSEDRLHQIALNSFQQVIQAVGYECLHASVKPMYTADYRTWCQFHRTLNEWMDAWRPPIGVFVPSADTIGRVLAESCRKRGILIPDQAALIVGDNEPAICQFASPTLTSLDIPYRSIGFMAAKLLDQLMLGESPQPQQEVSPKGIVGRQSTDFFAVEDDLVDAALRYISGNLGQPIQINDVCKGICTSRRTLDRRFRTALGRSVGNEIIRLRMDRAKRELAATQLPLKKIAENLGFQNPKRMNEVFTRELGLSPSRYRKSQQSSHAPR